MKNISIPMVMNMSVLDGVQAIFAKSARLTVADNMIMHSYAEWVWEGLLLGNYM